jgi:diguanylate cyclase (GGDEF)-like protein
VSGADRFPPSRRPTWTALAVAVVLIGALTSVLGARVLAQRDAAQTDQAVSASSESIAATLQLALQHEQDLAISSGSFVAGAPGASATAYRAWATSERAFQRYPELNAIATITLVPAAGLAAFAARESVDPAGALGSTGTLVVSPAGARPYYCLETGSVTRPGTLVGGAGVDYCDSALGPALLLARDSGKDTYLPYGSGADRALAVGSAIYRGGVEPTTEAARRAAFLGWTGSQIAPAVLMKAALVGHPATELAFRYGSGPLAAVFTAGHAPTAARTTTVNLHNGWFVATTAAATGSTVLANQNARALLLGGILISLLLALLIYTLGTGRSRAVLLVRNRTEELRHLAYHDALTGLPNRVLILDRLEQMMLRSRREDAKVGALFLDIDNFKDVNDTLGHASGDQLLELVAHRLTQILREGDTVGRLGGDEFVVLIDGNSLDDGPALAAQRILDVMAQPFLLDATEAPVTVTASIGIAEGVRPEPEDLLRDADIALNRAKAAGKHRTVIFAPRMQDAVDAHRTLELDLRGALAAGQFFVLYQPIFELETGRISGVEALIRWRHPTRGVVGPAEFIPTLESTGLIVPVGRWVLDEACRQGAAWQSVGHHLSVSVNLSAHQLEDGRLVEDVRQSLVSYGLAPDRLVLELTETILMHDVPSTVDQLAHLKSTGVRISIDDFGTGYSSFAYLRKFPIDILKIDQAFVATIADTWESAAIVHTLVQLGKVLGLEIVAEGIETEDQRSRLRAEEVDMGQGYLFARPLESSVIDHFLELMVTTPTAPA